MAFEEPQIFVWKLDSGNLLLSTSDDSGYFPGIYTVDVGGNRTKE